MINDSVEVFLRRVGSRPTRYMEYVRPGHVSKFKTQNMQCYVQAATEERFQIHIRLHHGFRYYTATCLEIRLWLDAHQEPDVYIYKKVSIPGDGRKYTEFVLKDFAVQVGDHWENGLLCFGQVQIDDEKDRLFRRSELKERSVKLGSIRVSIQRGRQDAEATPEEEPESVELDGHVSHSDNLNGITHYVKTVNGYVIDAPKSDSSTLFKRLAGAHGERFGFAFCYRSRAELQHLGMMDDEGRRIDPNAVLGDDDDLPVVSHHKAVHLGLNNNSTSPRMLASSPQFPRSVLQPVVSSQGLLSSPLAGYSTVAAQAPNDLGCHHSHIVSEMHTRPFHASFSAGTGYSYTSDSHASHRVGGSTQKNSMKKRDLSSVLQENNISAPPSSSPPTKKRVVVPAIDLTRSTSPMPPSSSDSDQASSKGSSLLPSDNLSNSHASGSHSNLRLPPFSPTITADGTTFTTASSSGPGAADAAVLDHMTAPSTRSPQQQKASPPPSAGLLPTYPYAPAMAASVEHGARADDDMSEAELRFELRRMEVQQRAFDIQQRQLEMQQRQMDYQIRLERMRRARLDGQEGGPADGT